MDELLSECLQGSKDAWDAFVDRYAPVIFAAVGRVLRARGAPAREHSPEDAAQEVFLRLVRNDFRLLRTYRPDRASLTTWLTIVARSTAIDLLRRKRLATVPLDDLPPPAKAEPPRPTGRPVADLPPGLLTARQRLVLGLLFDRQMDTPAAARLLGVSAQTVRSTKHKAVQRLREHFSAEDSS